jgi:hypothetical protein
MAKMLEKISGCSIFLRLARNNRQGAMMDGYQSEESVPGEVGDFMAVDDSSTHGTREASREGDVIHGLRSGLIFSLAIWAMLLTVGALFFD